MICYKGEVFSSIVRVLLVIFLLFGYVGSGQSLKQRIDSLLTKSNSIRDVYNEEKVVNTKAIGALLLDKTISKELKNKYIDAYAVTIDSLEVALMYSLLNFSLGQADTEYSLYFLNKGLSYVPANEYKLMADFYGNIGVNYAILSIDDVAVKNLLKGLEYINTGIEKGNKDGYYWVKKMLLTNIAELYINQKNVSLARKYYEESVSLNAIIPQDRSFKFVKVYELSIASDLAVLDGKRKAAENYLKEGIAICRETDDTDRESELLGKLGELQTDFDEQLSYLESSYQIAHQNHANSSFSIQSSNNLIEAYIKGLSAGQNYFSGKAISIRVSNLLKSYGAEVAVMDSKKQLSELYRLQSEFESWKGNFEKSLALHRAYDKLQDSIYSQENKNRIAALQSSTEIQLRDQEIASNKKVISAKEKQNWILFTGLFLVSVLVVMLLYQNQQRKKNNIRLNEANRIKTRFFTILNHDLRTPVGDLIRFLHLQREYPEIMDEATRKRLDNQTLTAVENLLVSMEDLLLWSKGQMINFKPEPEKINVGKLFKEIKGNYAVNEAVSMHFEVSGNLRLVTDKNYLKTIIRNLTSNALKALEQVSNPEIAWQAYENKKHIILAIRDNGPGSSSEKFKALYNEQEVIGIHNGLGLHLVRDMANSIGCTIEVVSEIGKGTTIRLHFKK